MADRSHGVRHPFAGLRRKPASGRQKREGLQAQRSRRRTEAGAPADADEDVHALDNGAVAHAPAAEDSGGAPTMPPPMPLSDSRAEAHADTVEAEVDDVDGAEARRRERAAHRAIDSVQQSLSATCAMRPADAVRAWLPAIDAHARLCRALGDEGALRDSKELATRVFLVSQQALQTGPLHGAKAAGFKRLAKAGAQAGDEHVEAVRALLTVLRALAAVDRQLARPACAFTERQLDVLDEWQSRFALTFLVGSRGASSA